MRRFLITIGASLALLIMFFSAPVRADAPLDIYLFWGQGCPHCAAEKAYLSELLPNYPGTTLHTYEIYYDSDNRSLMQSVGNVIGTNASGVPFLIIGDKSFVGYSEGITSDGIKSRIEYCLENTCPDSVAALAGIEKDTEPNEQSTPEPEQTTAQSEPTNEETAVQEDNPDGFITLPILGGINVKSFSLPVLTIAIGTLDGFNPCALWTLLFLISLLLGFKNRRRMWLLGGTFIAASGVVYFLFMAAWLQLILFLGLIVGVRLAIGTLAIGGGTYSIRKFFKNRSGGCDVAGDEKRTKTFEKLRAITKKRNLWLALGGIIALAFAVNLIELVCSAGLPAIYTQVLAMNNLATWQYYAYLALYIFFFMLDDILVFAAAMVTLKMTGISTKYARYSNLIGGSIMVIIGILLILKPEWLMFG